MLHGWTAVGVQLAMPVGVGLVVGRSPARRLATAALFAIAAIVPLATVGPPLPRAIAALGAVLVWLRGVDLLRDPNDYPLGKRIFIAGSLFDGRRVERVAPRLEPARWAAALGYAALAAASGYVVFVVAETLDGPGRWAARLGAGVVFGYCTADAIAGTVRALFLLGGVSTPLVQDRPILSRSVGEFWSRRWNRAVHEWLMRHCFMPLARRRRPRLGLAWAFVVSAAIHAWLVAAAIGDLEMTLWMAGFFLLQGAVIGLERRLDVGSWPTLARHVWTVGWLGGSSPLFIESFLRALGA